MRTLALSLASLVLASRAFAVCGNGVLEAGEDCDDGAQNGAGQSCCLANCSWNTAKDPNVIVGDIVGTLTFGPVGGITAYSVGTTSCNVGNCWLNWIANTPEHPVIGQNLYRLKDGRFEQIGQAWLKHGFTALAGSVCGACSNPGTGARLGVNCSDPYSNTLNADQDRMGPKEDVNPITGVFLFPDGRIDDTGDAIFKRLQVHTADVNPALNPGASYFVEAQYVAHDDAQHQNASDNASYRSLTVGASPPYNLTLTGTTQRTKPAIQAWRAADATVRETTIKGDDGTFFVSAKATSLGGGVWRYEYAVQNLTYHRAGQSFTVPIQPGATVTNVGFHDVDYHSGEPFSGTDWTPTVTSTSVSWATETFAVNPNANALRWGTLYNFRFDANVAPGLSPLTIGLFRPGTPTSVSTTQTAPITCGGAANGTSCNDFSPCTQTDTCVSSQCVGSNPAPNGTACNDANACTQTDGCVSGACVGANPVTCTALDQCHDAGVCQTATGVCTNPSKPDGAGCSDGNGCTLTDGCVSGACVGANPVTCTALDQCHDVGTCQAATGTCTNPNKANGVSCDDANACTDNDVCASGVCAGVGPVLPGDADALALAQAEGVTTISWTAGSGSATSSVLRGLVSQLPVGPGGAEELCLEDDLVGTTTTDPEDPGPGESFWYLIRGANACGDGSYGSEGVNGAPGAARQSTTCP
jgi:hypothetical protein